MNFPFQWLPDVPDFGFDWGALDREFSWIRAMAGCPQEPDFHAEGDVWIHTRMVCEALVKDAHWRALPSGECGVVFVAALMHDIAKPVCTRAEGGRITSRGHSVRGAIMAREILWRMNTPFAAREQAANLIRYHQIPFFLMDLPDPQRVLFAVSQAARCDLLALVTGADAQGRVCKDQQKLLDNIAFFRHYAGEQDCLNGPREFSSDHSRFLYFRKEGRDPDYRAFDDTECEVIVMAGLPGAGKSHWIAREGRDRPVVSLDQLRREMKVDPKANQGAVVARGRELARGYLRRKQSFIWNATNISRKMRGHILDLCAAYNARTRIVYVEAPEGTLFKRNTERENAVPLQVINRLLASWEPPDLTEAHRIEWIIG